MKLSTNIVFFFVVSALVACISFFLLVQTIYRLKTWGTDTCLVTSLREFKNNSHRHGAPYEYHITLKCDNDHMILLINGNSVGSEVHHTIIVGQSLSILWDRVNDRSVIVFYREEIVEYALMILAMTGICIGLYFIGKASDEDAP